MKTLLILVAASENMHELVECVLHFYLSDIVVVKFLKICLEMNNEIWPT